MYMKLLLPTDQDNQQRIIQGLLSSSICLVSGEYVTLVPEEDAIDAAKQVKPGFGKSNFIVLGTIEG
ncbi:hypothetical protein C5167_016699 [Papaver somniferum]|nr:hypothetical protein C5167_016699 [Papaver somniferum]